MAGRISSSRCNLAKRPATKENIIFSRSVRQAFGTSRGYQGRISLASVSHIKSNEVLLPPQTAANPLLDKLVTRLLGDEESRPE